MICKVCNNEKTESQLNNIFGYDEYDICYPCFLLLKPQVKEYKISGYPIMTLYRYDGKIKDLVYQYKGCADIALRNIFLQYFLADLRIKYPDYTISFAPSNKEENQKRGFNHIEELLTQLNNKKVDCFYKKINWKQSGQKFEERSKIKQIISINAGMLEGIKKLLIVDDVITSGNTIIACAELAAKHGIKKIKLLVVCRNVEKQHILSQ